MTVPECEMSWYILSQFILSLFPVVTDIILSPPANVWVPGQATANQCFSRNGLPKVETTQQHFRNTHTQKKSSTEWSGEVLLLSHPQCSQWQRKRHPWKEWSRCWLMTPPTLFNPNEQVSSTISCQVLRPFVTPSMSHHQSLSLTLVPKWYLVSQNLAVRIFYDRPGLHNYVMN